MCVCVCASYLKLPQLTRHPMIMLGMLRHFSVQSANQVKEGPFVHCALHVRLNSGMNLHYTCI